MKREISLPKLLSKGCVLQQNETVRIWGWCKGIEDITVQIQGVQAQAKADANGEFEAIFTKLCAGGPFALEFFAGQEKIHSVFPVYVGEVFVCSGQSNMELPMRRVQEYFPEEFEAGGCERIHVYKVMECAEFSKPRKDHKEAAWYSCTGENLAEISAFSYFFGKFIKESKQVPVGILNISLGGTPVEAWTSREGLRAYPELWAITEHFQKEEAREAVLQEQEAREHAWYTSLKEQEKHTQNAPWKPIKLPGVFAEQGLERFSGLLWLRRTFHVKKGEAGKRALLRFGTMVDSDEIFINQTLVGETSYCYPPRRYEIPVHVLQEGENEILIKLICRDGKGRVTEGKDYEILTETKEKIALDGMWEYQVRGTNTPARELRFFHRSPGVLFQGMIAPCLPFAVRGVVWYQGESNDAHPDSYEALLKNMINAWRAHWKQEKLPFFLVQLPNCNVDIAPGEAWPKIREAQKQAGTLPDTAVTVNLDLGEDHDLHPWNKKENAYRVFLAAEKLLYGKDIVWEGPKLKKIERQEGSLLLEFDTKDHGELSCKNKQEQTLFELLDREGNVYKTSGKVCGTQVLLDSRQVEKAVKVRYAWASAPGDNLLYNQTGLPAEPFCVEI